MCCLRSIFFCIGHDTNDAVVSVNAPKEVPAPRCETTLLITSPENKKMGNGIFIDESSKELRSSSPPATAAVAAATPTVTTQLNQFQPDNMQHKNDPKKESNTNKTNNKVVHFDPTIDWASEAQKSERGATERQSKSFKRRQEKAEWKMLKKMPRDLVNSIEVWFILKSRSNYKRIIALYNKDEVFQGLFDTFLKLLLLVDGSSTNNYGTTTTTGDREEDPCNNNHTTGKASSINDRLTKFQNKSSQYNYHNALVINRDGYKKKKQLIQVLGFISQLRGFEHAFFNRM